MLTARVTWPKLRRSIPRSARILATTGRAATDRASAMKAAYRPLPASPMKEDGVRSATTPTTASGTSRPPAETLTAARRKRMMIPRSVSYPMTTSSMITASQATPYTTDPAVESEKSQSKTSG